MITSAVWWFYCKPCTMKGIISPCGYTELTTLSIQPNLDHQKKMHLDSCYAVLLLKYPSTSVLIILSPIHSKDFSLVQRFYFSVG